jgi:hypothetical protein
MCVQLYLFFYKDTLKMSEQQEPTVITLDNQNSVQILAQYIEVAQQKGAYLLNEAEILKRAMDVIMNNVHDKDIDANMAKQLLIQGVTKGQRHGAYTLNDAALLSKVVVFVVQGVQGVDGVQSQTDSSVSQEQSTVQSVSQSVDPDDLSDLADPIPLKPKEV